MKKLSLLIAPVAGFALWAGAAVAGPSSLLGVSIDYPRINFVPSSTTQKVTYDGVNLTLASTPIFTTFTSGGTSEFMVSGSLSLTAPIDAAGMISGGGTFSISGTVTDTATSTSYSGVLLEGTVTDYGISDLGATDLADFRLAATGGSMKSLFDARGSEVGMVVALEGSTYIGSFASSWSAARAKGDVGPIPDIVPEPPHTIGYWKNHPEAWPVSSLTICGNSINQSDLIGVLSTPVRGDKTISMAHQLIAAMLNAATGNSCSGPISDAANWLCSHGGIGGNRKDWDGGEELKNTLDTFNNGGGCS